MTIAEKLKLIADRTPQVAQAVKAARVTDSGKAIRVDGDLALELKATPDAQVTVYGKNLFDRSAALSYQEAVVTAALVEGKLKITTKDAGKMRFAAYVIPQGDALAGKTVSLRGYWSCSGSNKGAAMLMWTRSDSILYSVLRIGGPVTSAEKFTVTIPPKPENGGALCIFFYANTDGTAKAGDSVTFWGMQLELGNSPTTYAEFQKAKTITADSQGSITGVSLNYPVTLFCDGELSCRYFPPSAAALYETYQQLKEAFHV